MYKKIGLACAALATAGLLMAGFYREGGTSLRKETYQKLSKVPGNAYFMDTNDHRIDVKIPYDSDEVVYYTPNQAFGLEVTITNTETGDTLTMRDWEVFRAMHSIYIPSKEAWNGVDEVYYNGLTNGTEGMDERFDEALRISKPVLEEKIKQRNQKIYEAKENTKLHKE